MSQLAYCGKSTVERLIKLDAVLTLGSLLRATVATVLSPGIHMG